MRREPPNRAAQIIELGIAAAFNVGMRRLPATWHLTGHVAECYAGSGTVTPW
ncbi:MAG: hypothetical protein ACLP9Y_07210 [Mycobacterium sp.]